MISLIMIAPKSSSDAESVSFPSTKKPREDDVEVEEGKREDLVVSVEDENTRAQERRRRKGNVVRARLVLRGARDDAEEEEEEEEEEERCVFVCDAFICARVS